MCYLYFSPNTFPKI